MPISPFAGKPADPSLLINVPRLGTAYYTRRPDPAVPAGEPITAKLTVAPGDGAPSAVSR
jgi:hypothetical protein